MQFISKLYILTLEMQLLFEQNGVTLKMYIYDLHNIIKKVTLSLHHFSLHIKDKDRIFHCLFAVVYICVLQVNALKLTKMSLSLSGAVISVLGQFPVQYSEDGTFSISRTTLHEHRNPQ